MQTNHLSTLLAASILPFLLLVAACAPAATQAPTTTPAPTELPVPTATLDPQLALVGGWTTTVTKEDILRVMPDFHQEALCDNSGTFVMTFNTDGTFTVDQSPLSECQGQTSQHLESKWSATGNLITLDTDTPDEGMYEFDINGDLLTLKAKSSNCPPCIAVNTANPWTRVE